MLIFDPPLTCHLAGPHHQKISNNPPPTRIDAKEAF
jgi:hypothetical protein